MSLPLENERSELTDVITTPSKSTATYASAFSEVFNLSNQKFFKTVVSHSKSLSSNIFSSGAFFS